MTSKQSSPEIWGLPFSQAEGPEPTQPESSEPTQAEQDVDDEQVKELFATQPNTLVEPPMSDKDVEDLFTKAATDEAVKEAPKKKKH